MLKVVHRVITRFLLKQASAKADEADSGAVTLIQRFGSAANLNVHLLCLVEWRDNRATARRILQHAESTSYAGLGSQLSKMDHGGQALQRVVAWRRVIDLGQGIEVTGIDLQ